MLGFQYSSSHPSCGVRSHRAGPGVLWVLLGQGSWLAPLCWVLHGAELVVLVCRGAFFLLIPPLCISTFLNHESVLFSSVPCTAFFKRKL